MNLKASLKFLDQKYKEINHPAYQQNLKKMLQKQNNNIVSKQNKIEKLQAELRIIAYNIEKMQEKRK